MAHDAHHLTFGRTFYQDHAVFGQLYAAYLENYDDVIELAIANGEITAPDQLLKINGEAAREYVKWGGFRHPDTAFEQLIEMEDTLLKQIDDAIKRLDTASVNMLQGLAQQSKHRAGYKMVRRIKE